MAKFFASRAKVSKNAPDYVKNVQRDLEREIEREMAVLSIAMPFLPKDQVRGIVQKKLGLETGKNLLRKGGARIDYKNISLDFPKSPVEQRSTCLASPRNIRKKLLGRSEAFNIVGRNYAIRKNRQEEATNDAFRFNQASPTDHAPRPFERKTPRSPKRRPKKPLKRRLFTLSENEDDFLLECNDDTAPVESRAVKPPIRNICSLTSKKQTEEGQPAQSNQTSQSQPKEPERRRSVSSDSDDQIAEAGGFTHNSSDDDSEDPTNLQSRRDGMSAVSNNEDFLMEDNPSPVLNSKSGKSARRGRLDQDIRSTTNDHSKSEIFNKSSPILDKNSLRRARLSLSKKSTGTADKTAELYQTTSGVPKSPTPASAILPVRNQSNTGTILEELACPEEMLMDAAVVPTSPSDAANTSITPPTGGNTRSAPVSDAPSEAGRTRNINAECDGSDSSLSKDEYSGTPQSSLEAKSSAQQGKRSLITASRTLSRHRAATRKDSPDGTTMMRSTFHGSLTLQKKNDSPASSGRSARSSALFSSSGSVDSHHNYDTSESARAVRPRGESSPCSVASTPDSIPQSAVLPVQNQSNHILEIPDSQEETLTDAAVVPATPSDAASTSTTSPRRGNTRSGLVSATPREADHIRIINEQSDGSHKLPGSSLSKDEYSDTPQSSLTAKSSALQGKNSLILASRTLWRNWWAAAEKDRSGKISMVSSSQGALELQEKNNNPASSERSAMSSARFSSQDSVDKDNNYSTPESAQAVRPTEQSSPSFKTSTPNSWTGLDRTPVRNSAEMYDHSLMARETAQAAGQRASPSWRSTSSTPKSAFQQIPSPPQPAWKRDCSTEDAAHRSSASGSSNGMPAKSGYSSHRPNPQERPNNLERSGNTSAASSTENNHNYSSPKLPVTPSELLPFSEKSTCLRSPLPPYPAWKSGSSDKDAEFYSSERNSSAEISTMSSTRSRSAGSSTRGSCPPAEIKISGKTSDRGSAQRDHNYSSPTSVQSVTPSELSIPFSEKSACLRSPLPPYPAWKSGSSEKDSAYYLSEQNNSAEISGSSTRGSYPLTGINVFGKTSEDDHNNSSPKSVQSFTPREPSPSASKRSTSPSVLLLPYPAWRGGSSTKDAADGGQQLRSSSTEDTPTSLRPYRGLSTKKGIPRINPDMTARRTLFQGGDFATGLDPSQEEDAEEPAESQVLFSSPVRDLSDDGNNLLKDGSAPASQKHISAITLLLKKGAERLDGLPFPSGEAVRPFSAEWLHQKKLSSLPDSLVTVTRRRSSRGDSNVWGSTEAMLVVKKTDSQRVQPSQQTSSLLFPEDDLELMGGPLLATLSQEQNTLEEGQWWKEDNVMRALSQLGVEDIADTNTCLETQLVTQSSEESIRRTLSSFLSLESSVQGQDVQADVKAMSRLLYSQESGVQREKELLSREESGVQRGEGLLSSQESVCRILE